MEAGIPALVHNDARPSANYFAAEMFPHRVNNKAIDEIELPA